MFSRCPIDTKCTLDILKMPFSSIMLPADEQKPPLPDRELDVGENQFMWQCVYPSLERCDLAPPDKRVDYLLHQAYRLLEICCCQSVVNGVAHQAMLLIPGARTPVEFGHLGRLPALQAMAQRLSEELVVAIPESLIIQRREEEISLLQLLQHRLTACLLARLSHLSHHSHHGLTE